MFSVVARLEIKFFYRKENRKRKRLTLSEYNKRSNKLQHLQDMLQTQTLPSKHAAFLTLDD